MQNIDRIILSKIPFADNDGYAIKCVTVKKKLQEILPKWH